MISSEDIERNGLTWAMSDNFRLKRDPVVVNTDITYGAGVHWIVIAPLSDCVYIYDPLGPSNKRATGSGLPSDGYIINRLHKQGHQIIKWYPYTSQLKSSSLCGWFSIFVAKILNALGSPSAAEATAAIHSQFGKRADASDERLLRKVFS